MGVGKATETWRGTIEREMAEVAKTRNELKWLAKNRSEWWKLGYASKGADSENGLS